MIIFRADANTSIGMGHIMRCLSLAEAMAADSSESMVINRGKKNIKFIIADESVSNLIQSCGYEPIILHTDYRAMDGEIDAWKELAPSIDVDLVIIDSYYVTSDYLNWLRHNIGMVCYIDDVLSFSYPVDILINYNAYANIGDYHRLYKGCEEPKYLLGPTYAPLRAMFRDIDHREQRSVVTDVLLSTGGSDELHVAVSFLRYLCNEKDDKSEGITYHLLLGMMNTDKDEIKALAADDDRIKLHENVSDMRWLISSMDIVVSAAGSTLYEICACGVPLITFSTADNQIPGAEAFKRLGLADNVGDLRDPESINSNLVMSGKLSADANKRIMSAVNNMARNKESRTELGIRQQALIDGYGAERIAARLMEIVRENIRLFETSPFSATTVEDKLSSNHNIPDKGRK